MCGIFGVIGEVPGRPDLSGALDTLRHRGPDDRGVWTAPGVWLGHRRLAILDLSDSGHQPLVDAETGVAVTYNGEIYNYVELRRDLERAGHHFRSQCDTEVLMRAYLEWGSGCVSRFDGMWAFVVWDPRSRCALLSRDHFGIKPLCYAACDRGLVFASEPKAILYALPSLRSVDETSIVSLLADRQSLPDTRTFYRQISSVAPATVGTYRAGDPTPRFNSYWTYPVPSSQAQTSEASMVREFSRRFGESVTRRLRSDVPVGVTLSGGIDSTAILDAVLTCGERSEATVRAYTASYPDASAALSEDERTWARRAASRYGKVELVEVPATVENWVATMCKIVWHMDGPDHSPAVFPMWMIMEQARLDGFKVLLEGQGADEVFAGYRHYAALNVIDSLQRASIDRDSLLTIRDAVRAGVRIGSAGRLTGDIAVASIHDLHAWQSRRTTLRTAIPQAGRLRPAAAAAAKPALSGARLEHQLHADLTREKLPGFLRYGDAISMAHSIEARVPFLDHQLVEWAVKLPPGGRIAAGETKRILRQHLRTAGQAAIADRRDKRGYPTPTGKWLAANRGEILREHLLDRDALVAGLIDRHAVRRMIDRHAAGRHVATDCLYALLGTELWWQQVSSSTRSSVASAVEFRTKKTPAL